MKNTVKALMMIGALVQGTATFSLEGAKPNFQVNFVSAGNKVAYSVTVEGAAGASCVTSGTVKAVCQTSNYSGGDTIFGSSKFIVRDGTNSCEFQGKPEGLAGPLNCNIPEIKPGNIVNQNPKGPVTVNLP